ARTCRASEFRRQGPARRTGRGEQLPELSRPAWALVGTGVFGGELRDQACNGRNVLISLDPRQFLGKGATHELSPGAARGVGSYAVGDLAQKRCEKPVERAVLQSPGA